MYHQPVTQELWTAVDDYISDLFVPEDDALKTAISENAKAGLPPIDVSPAQGKLLHLLARIQGASSILEIGTLGGYSTIWLARALPTGGHLLTLESEATHAEVARRNIARAGLSDIVDLRLGLANESLRQLHEDGDGPFDFIFIDADKESYASYFEWSLHLSRPGTVIVADNVIRDGGVIEEDHGDPRVHGVRRFNELAAKDSRVSSTQIQTVGRKGYDGFAMILVASI